MNSLANFLNDTKMIDTNNFFSTKKKILLMLPKNIIVMSEEERLHRKKLRMRPKMVKRAYELGLIEYSKYHTLISLAMVLWKKNTIGTIHEND